MKYFSPTRAERKPTACDDLCRFGCVDAFTNPGAGRPGEAVLQKKFQKGGKVEGRPRKRAAELELASVRHKSLGKRNAASVPPQTCVGGEKRSTGQPTARETDDRHLVTLRVLKKEIAERVITVGERTLSVGEGKNKGGGQKAGGVGLSSTTT